MYPTYTRSYVDKTMPRPEPLRAKEMNENLVAFDGEKEHWFEFRNGKMVEWDVLKNRDANQISLHKTLTSVFARFAEDNQLSQGEQNFLKCVMLCGIGPLPKELDKFRGIGLTFGPTRPSTYYSLFQRFQWYDDGAPTLVYCDSFAGVEELPRLIAEDLSYSDTTGSIQIISGTGKNVIASAREKLDGKLVCHIETVSPNVGYVCNYKVDNCITLSDIAGYGYTEFLNGTHYHVSGSIDSVQRPFQNFDSFVDVAEGLILNISGVSYKLRKLNTYEITVSKQGMAYDFKNIFVGPLKNPKKLRVGANKVYECFRDKNCSSIVAKRFFRDSPQTLSQINAIVNAPILSDYAKFLTGQPIFVAPPPTLITGKTYVELSSARGESVPDVKKRPLTLGKFVSIVSELTVLGSTTVESLLQAVSSYSVVMSIEKILRLLAFAGCSYRSNFVRRHPKENVMRFNDQAFIRSEDEIVVGESDLGIVPIVRSLFVYDTFLPRYRPRTVAFSIAWKNKVFFSHPPGFNYWDFAAGGMVAWGETPDQAIVREVGEEMNEVIVVHSGHVEFRGASYFLKRATFNSIEMWSNFFFYHIEIEDEYNFQLGEGRIGEWKVPRGVPMRHDYELVRIFSY